MLNNINNLMHSHVYLYHLSIGIAAKRITPQLRKQDDDSEDCEV